MVTYGGYSKRIVTREEFVLRLPEGLDPSRAGPLMCAGITAYSPLRQWNVGPGSRVAVVGIEIIAIDTVNEAFSRIERGDVRYRFVVDMSSLVAV